MFMNFLIFKREIFHCATLVATKPNNGTYYVVSFYSFVFVPSELGS